MLEAEIWVKDNILIYCIHLHVYYELVHEAGYIVNSSKDQCNIHRRAKKENLKKEKYCKNRINHQRTYRHEFNIEDCLELDSNLCKN